MTDRTAAAIGIWRARETRTVGDRAFVVYLALLVALVTVLPVARAVWLGVTSAEGVAVFASPAAPGTAVLVAAAVWAGGLLLGRDRGPALRAPFLTHALASSDLPRSEAFGRPVLWAGAIVTALTTIAAGLISGSLFGGPADPLGAVVFVAVGVHVGVVATVCSLAGQAFPRVAVPAALGVLALGAVAALAPAARPFTPWGWVGLAYPGGGSPHAVAALCALTALTLALLAVAPVLMSRLSSARLVAQAVRWDTATVHATGMDFGAAVTIYQARPRLGRRLRAVHPMLRRPLLFLLRDAIGAVRTPGRLVIGILAVAAAGTLLSLAFAPGAPGWVLGVAAGVLLFAGLGPLIDGVRHAASVAADFPLYGISDERLLVHHTLFPLTVMVIVLIAAVIVCALLLGTPAAGPVAGVLALGVLDLLARIGGALKPPLPPVLLVPIPTPMGDLGAAVRMAWALDGVLYAVLAGACAALVVTSPGLAGALALVLTAVVAGRWRARR